MTTQQQKRYKILLIGDACVDTYTFGSVNRISPEAPVPVFEPHGQIVKDGMAGNVLNNLEALGCQVKFFHGEISHKERLIDDRSKQQLLRIDRDKISTPLDYTIADTSEYDAVVISDYNKGTVDYNLITHLVKTSTVPIFIDTKKTDLAPMNGCFVKINALEKSRATSLPHKDWLVVTYGDKGAVWNDIVFSPTESVTVADVTGAGDTFLSALAYKYLSTGDMNEAIKFANKAASLTVQHVGVHAPRLEEIL